MCLVKDCSARCLIYTTGFHTYNTVLYDVADTDSVLSTELIKLHDNLRYLHLLSVYTCWYTFFKCHGYIFTRIWSFFWCNTKYEQMLIVWLAGRILKLKTFMADVP